MAINQISTINFDDRHPRSGKATKVIGNDSHRRAREKSWNKKNIPHKGGEAQCDKHMRTRLSTRHRPLQQFEFAEASPRATQTRTSEKVTAAVSRQAEIRGGTKHTRSIAMATKRTTKNNKNKIRIGTEGVTHKDGNMWRDERQQESGKLPINKTSPYAPLAQAIQATTLRS